jgi:hypothetical protein
LRQATEQGQESQTGCFYRVGHGRELQFAYAARERSDGLPAMCNTDIRISSSICAALAHPPDQPLL